MSDSAPSFLSPPLTLDGLPGHDIRRLHQISVAIFMQETEAFGVTPVQYAALQAVGHQPGMDQRTLARTIGFDTSTIAGVIDRLEARGLMQRNASAQDRPLPEAERGEFMRMLAVLIAGHRAVEDTPGAG